MYEIDRECPGYINIPETGGEDFGHTLAFDLSARGMKLEGRRLESWPYQRPGEISRTG